MEPLTVGDRGRRKITQNPSKEKPFKPHSRYLVPAPSGDFWDKKTGKKFIKEPNPWVPAPGSRRHNVAADKASGYDYPDIPLIESSKGFVKWPDCDNARNWVSKEYVLEQQFQTKKRVPNMQAKRNGISLAAPGDKLYKNVDYSPNFFKVEGVIPGSCIGVHRVARTMQGIKADSTQQMDGINYRPQPSYEEKVRAKTLDDEVSSVRDVAMPEGTKGDYEHDSDDDE